MHASPPSVTVVGGGLAGTEAAWQLAKRGLKVTLVEMRPDVISPAHHSSHLAELVCSNSLKSDDPSTAAGTLKRELELMGSIVLATARRCAVPAGAALAVDRNEFSSALTHVVASHPLIDVRREEATRLPASHAIVATGPLTSPAMELALSEVAGADRLHFFDAAAPVIEAESIDRTVVFAASRYDKGGGADYLNAPMTRDEYEVFHEALVTAERVVAKDFERRELFCACQPVEEIARTGRDALRFGPMKPVGLTDPRTGERPWAVVQLRAENRDLTAYNLVGFQTNLKWPEQRRVFGLIPGLREAEYARFGVLHRNTFLDAPSLLEPTLRLRTGRPLWLAGQLTGTEGYLEAAASGLLAAVNLYADASGLDPFVLPRESVFGALIAHATDPHNTHYQPMHVNFGIIEPLPQRVRGKRERYAAYSARALEALRFSVNEREDLFAEARHAGS